MSCTGHNRGSHPWSSHPWSAYDRGAYDRGFTLIEMIVSVGLFSIVMVIATGAYLTLIDLDRRTRTENDVVSDLSFAVDGMARAIRTGTHYGCGVGGGDCWADGGNRFSFTDEQSRTITYLLRQDHTIGRCITSPCTDASSVSLTGPGVSVDGLVFHVRGTSVVDGLSPRAIITITGHTDTFAGGTATPIAFTIQTAATQRIIDL